MALISCLLCHIHVHSLSQLCPSFMQHASVTSSSPSSPSAKAFKLSVAYFIKRGSAQSHSQDFRHFEVTSPSFPQINPLT